MKEIGKKNLRKLKRKKKRENEKRKRKNNLQWLWHTIFT